jgi:hypothetical protein
VYQVITVIGVIGLCIETFLFGLILPRHPRDVPTERIQVELHRLGPSGCAACDRELENMT